MAFINERIPDRIVSGFAIAPRFHTLIVEMDNGGEQRDGKWLFPKFEGQGNMGIFTPADRQWILKAQMASRGRLHAFRVKNPLDYTATAQPLYDYNGTVYLSKAWTLGTETTYQLIHAPVTATLTTGSVDMNTGIVTGADPEVDTWTGTFDLWMRFQADWNAVRATTKDVWDFDIDLIEVPRR